MRGAWNSFDRWGWVDPAQPVNWQQDLNVGLMGWWLVCPAYAGGTTLVDLCKRNDGTLTSMEPATDWSGPAGRPGGFGSLDIDTDDYVLVGDDTIFDITDTITLSAWVKFNSDGAAQQIVGRDDGTNRNYSLHRWTSDLLYMHFWISGVDKLVGVSVSSGEWMLATGVYDGSKAYIYVNGQEAATPLSASGSIDNDDVSLAIGARANPDRYMDGQLDDVRIHNVAWSADQVAKYYDVSCQGYPGVLNRLRVPTHYTTAAPAGVANLFYLKPLLGVG